jgi:hypothetical protein
VSSWRSAGTHLIDASIVLVAHDSDEIVTTDSADLKTVGNYQRPPRRAHPSMKVGQGAKPMTAARKGLRTPDTL